MRQQKLSVFFPMYNEKQNISHVLNRAQEVIPTLGFADYEILVIDDGSSDGCDQVVKSYAEHNQHIHLIQHPCNLGYGAALDTGFTQATGDYVFYTDSDLPVDLQDIARVIPLLENADVVVGYRIKRHETVRRAIYSRIYNILMRLLFGVHVRDVNFSFKLVSRSVLQKIRLSARTVFIDGQLLAESIRHGFRIVEIPVEYIPRHFGHSSFDSLRVAWDTLNEMLACWLLHRFGIGQSKKEPVKSTI